VPDPTAIITGVVRPLDRLDVDFPDETVRLLAVWDAVGQVRQPVDTLAGQLDQLTVDNVADRIRQAALDQAAHQGALGILQRLGHRIGAALTASLHADADRIVADLASRYGKAADTVHNAARLLRPDDDPAAILDRGHDHATAYLTMRDTLPVLDLIHQARYHLSATCGYGTPDPAIAMFIDNADNLDQLRTAARAYRNTSGTGGRWLALAAAGFRLNLNTADQARTLVGAAERATAKAKADRDRTPPRPPVLSYGR
jgi:hypothetical protein